MAKKHRSHTRDAERDASSRSAASSASPSPPPDAAATQAASGPSYPLPVRVLATALLAALVVSAGPAVGGLLSGQAATGDLVVTALLAVVIGVGWYAIVFGRTHIDAQVLRQRGLRTKEVQRNAIQQAKLVFIPGLQWIVVPRLVVRTGAFGMATFTAGNAELLAAFQDLMAARHPGAGSGSAR